MKSIFRILFAPLVWLAQSCSPLGEPFDASVSKNHYYNNSKNDIIYSPAGNWFELGKTPMHADVESFQVLNGHLGKDKDRAYYEYQVITHPEIDLASFTAKAEVYMSNIGFDKNQVYLISTEYEDGVAGASVTTIPNADPSTFEQTDFNWGKDSKNHYYRYKSIDVDYNTFKVLNDNFSKDRDTVYMHFNGNFQNIEADAKTFGILDGSLYSKDHRNLYYLLFNKEETDKVRLLNLPREKDVPAQLLNPYYLRYGDKIYFAGKEIPEAEAENFQIVSELYAKDSETVYFEDKIIPGADASTFHYSDSTFSVSDKNGKYRNGTLYSDQ